MHDHNELRLNVQRWNLVTDAPGEVKFTPVAALFTVASLSHVGPANRSGITPESPVQLMLCSAADPDGSNFWTKTLVE
jgi:hypothetical protein